MPVSGIASDVGRDQFLQLLVAQLQNQDPLNPVQNEDFIAQLAQFSTLEGIESLNASFSDMLALQQLTQGSNLIGRVASYRDANNVSQQGTIEAFRVEDGKLQLIIDGQSVALGSVSEIS